jgi:hypothetical protein
MDNKQHRQFYWEVKDFLTKKHNNDASIEKSPTLKDVSKNILEQNNIFKQKKSQATENTISNTKNVLSSLEKQRRGYDVSCVAYTRNNIANPFNKNVIYEYTDSNETIARKRMEAEARNERARARNTAENDRLSQAKQDVKRKREEDEAYQFNQEISAGSQGQGPTPSGGNLADTLEMGRDGNPNLPADTPENRARMGQWRREKAETKQAEYMASRIAELSGKKPEELTSQEAGELSLMKSMTQGKVATRGLEGKIQGNLEAKAKVSPLAMEPTAGTDDTGRTQEQIDMDAMASGKQRKAAAQDMMQRTIGRSQEDLVSRTQQAGAEEAEQRAQDNADFYAQQAEKKRAAMQNTRIQGTNMTYGQFEAEYGRPYDATNREDSTMLVRAASNTSAFRVSPTARALDQTTVDFNRTYRGINAQNAAREGELDRRVDQSQISLDQFNADRRGTVQREISSIQARPGFVRGVAQSMLPSGTTPPKIGQPNTPTGGAKPTGQPARIGAPSLSQAINSVLGNNNTRRA